MEFCFLLAKDLRIPNKSSNKSSEDLLGILTSTKFLVLLCAYSFLLFFLFSKQTYNF